MTKKDFNEIIKPLSLLDKSQRDFIGMTIRANFIKWQEKQLPLDCVSESFAADVRNKLSPPKNLCAILEDMHVTKKLDSDIAEIVEQSIKQTKVSIAYLSDISTYSR